MRHTKGLSALSGAIALCVGSVGGLAIPAVAVGAPTYDPAYVTRVGNTWYVAPTGVDDTANLRGVLDEASAVFAATGATDIVVHLGEAGNTDPATFSLSDALGPRNWSGTIEGVGKGITTLTNVYGSTWDGIYRVDGSDRGFIVFGLDESWDYSTVANITVQGLSILPVGGSLTADTRPFVGVLVLGDDVPGNPGLYKADLTFHDLAFVARSDITDFWNNLPVPFGVYDGYWGEPSPEVPTAPYIRPMQANITITAVDAENVVVLMDAWGIAGEVTIGGSPEDTVTITDAGAVGLEFGNPTGATIDISYLETDNAAGAFFGMYSTFWASPGFPFAPNQVEFHDNQIHKLTGLNYAGIEVWDEHPTVNSSISIHDNWFHDENNALWGPIWLFSTVGAEITGNTFTGSGPAAMYLGAADWWGADDRDMTVTDNDVLGFRPRQLPSLVQGGIRVVPAHYWMGTGTHDNLIEGQDEVSDRVLDLGTDNEVYNAMHIQMGPPDGPPGLDLKAAAPLLLGP